MKELLQLIALITVSLWIVKQVCLVTGRLLGFSGEIAGSVGIWVLIFCGIVFSSSTPEKQAVGLVGIAFILFTVWENLIGRPARRRKAQIQINRVERELLADTDGMSDTKIIDKLNAKSYDEFHRLADKYQMSFYQVEDIKIAIVEKLLKSEYDRLGLVV